METTYYTWIVMRQSQRHPGVWSRVKTPLTGVEHTQTAKAWCQSHATKYRVRVQLLGADAYGIASIETFEPESEK